jgi:1-acyl-sn-glycerol-3-phosphate acyltransferase
MQDQTVTKAQKCLLVFVNVVLRLFARFRVYGRENIEGFREPLIVAANHRGLLDPPLVGTAFSLEARVFPLRYIAKPAFFGRPIMAFLFHLYGAFSATEFRKAIHCLRDDGGTLVIFPEGKIAGGEQMLDSKLGVGMLAMMFPDIYIVPISIVGTENAIKNMLLLKRPHITMKIGKPFTMREALRDHKDPVSERHCTKQCAIRKAGTRAQQEKAASIITDAINRYLEQ